MLENRLNSGEAISAVGLGVVGGGGGGGGGGCLGGGGGWGGDGIELCNHLTSVMAILVQNHTNHSHLNNLFSHDDVNRGLYQVLSFVEIVLHFSRSLSFNADH